MTSPFIINCQNQRLYIACTNKRHTERERERERESKIKNLIWKKNLIYYLHLLLTHYLVYNLVHFTYNVHMIVFIRNSPSIDWFLHSNKAIMFVYIAPK